VLLCSVLASGHVLWLTAGSELCSLARSWLEIVFLARRWLGTVLFGSELVRNCVLWLAAGLELCFLARSWLGVVLLTSKLLSRGSELLSTGYYTTSWDIIQYRRISFEPQASIPNLSPEDRHLY
jgi:hypothetical protein